MSWRIRQARAMNPFRCVEQALASGPEATGPSCATSPKQPMEPPGTAPLALNDSAGADLRTGELRRAFPDRCIAEQQIAVREPEQNVADGRGAPLATSPSTAFAQGFALGGRAPKRHHPALGGGAPGKGCGKAWGGATANGKPIFDAGVQHAHHLPSIEWTSESITNSANFSQPFHFRQPVDANVVEAESWI